MAPQLRPVIDWAPSAVGEHGAGVIPLAAARSGARAVRAPNVVARVLAR